MQCPYRRFPRPSRQNTLRGAKSGQYTYGAYRGEWENGRNLHWWALWFPAGNSFRGYSSGLPRMLRCRFRVPEGATHLVGWGGCAERSSPVSTTGLPERRAWILVGPPLSLQRAPARVRHPTGQWDRSSCSCRWCPGCFRERGTPASELLKTLSPFRRRRLPSWRVRSEIPTKTF